MANPHSQIDEIISSLEAAEKRLIALAARTDSGKWMTRNRPEGWSITECIEHLNMTSRAFIPLIRSALEGDRAPAAGPRRFRRDIAGFLLSAMVGPLRKIGRTRIGRVKTTAEFEPKDLVPKSTSIADFQKLQSELIHLIRSSTRHALSDIKIISPFGGKLRYNLFSAFKVLPRHQHRHLQQAESVWN